MKKTLSFLVALVLILGTCGSALALNYTGNMGNASTFETLTEARISGPEFFKTINPNGNFASHPVLDGYPGDTTYVYRSADMYGRNAAVRLNTNIMVFVEKAFADKAEALAYLTELGLVDIIEQAKGSILLVTPANGTAFAAADQKNYYALQTTIFALNASATIDGVRTTYTEPQYYGGFHFLYLIGVDGGATFLNNYIAGSVDFVGRVGGMLLVNGQMDRYRSVADKVPVYLVNAPEAIVAKYNEVNGVDRKTVTAEKTVAYNHEFPVRKVVTVETDVIDLPALVNDAYYSLFVKTIRGQEKVAGMVSAGTPYQGYGQDCAPYSLSEHNPLIDGVTADGIYEITHVEDRFANIQTPAGEYLETWYEYLPEEVLNNTAQPGTIPLILTNHGGGDDPRQYVIGQGYLELAGKERIAIVSPEKASLHVNDANGNPVLNQVLPELVKYMIATYPAIDASRVYVTGYSMGGLATFAAILGDPGLFAAAFPQAGIRGINPTPEQAALYDDVDLPIAISTSEKDMAPNTSVETGGISMEFYNLISCYLELNGMDPLPEANFEKYPFSGFEADIYATDVINDEYGVTSWSFVNDDGVPMVNLTFVDDIVHCVYPQYAGLVWNFFKHYSRNLETGAVVYNPYVR